MMVTRQRTDPQDEKDEGKYKTNPKRSSLFIVIHPSAATFSVFVINPSAAAKCVFVIHPFELQ